jgi:hypothetical protein
MYSTSLNFHLMKKLLLSWLAAAGSWAFYPKATTPGAYLMVVGSGRPGTKSAVPEITVIQPVGTQQVQELTNIKIGTERYSAAATALHRAELLKVNSLVAQGWRVAHLTQSTVGVGATTETVYLLERR